jgi:hypothetical protein
MADWQRNVRFARHAARILGTNFLAEEIFASPQPDTLAPRELRRASRC